MGMIRNIAAATSLALAAPLAAQETSPLDWLVGEWCTAPDPTRGERTCEVWKPMENGVMPGISQVRHERMTEVETMRITRDGGGYVFHAEPRGQAPADFRAAADDVAALAITFENRDHDYPQRVRYWRDGDRLMAEIAMADGSKAVTWEYHRGNE